MGTDISKRRTKHNKATSEPPRRPQPQEGEETSGSAGRLHCPCCFSEANPENKFCHQCGGRLTPGSLLKDHEIAQPTLLTSSRAILDRAAQNPADDLQEQLAPKSARKPVTPRVKIVPRSFGELMGMLGFGLVLIYLAYFLAYKDAVPPVTANSVEQQNSVAVTNLASSSDREPDRNASEPESRSAETYEQAKETEGSAESATPAVAGQYSNEYPWRELYSDFVYGGYLYYSYDKESRQAQYFAQFLPCLNQDSLPQQDTSITPLWNYWLYDLDLDGTPELFIRYGSAECNAVIHIFTVNSTGMVSLGKVNGFHTSLCGLQGIGVLTDLCQMGYESLGLLTLKGTCLENQELAGIDHNKSAIPGTYDSPMDLYLKFDHLPSFEFDNTSGLSQTNNPGDNNRAILEENNVQLP